MPDRVRLPAYNRQTLLRNEFGLHRSRAYAEDFVPHCLNALLEGMPKPHT
jgi:hypothetical protein